MSAEPTTTPELVKPTSIVKLVDDDKHNAFTALAKWKNLYWLSFRKGASHNYGEADLPVMRSSDGSHWEEVARLNILPDDRDPQFLVTPKRLILYANSLTGAKLTAYALYTEDGKTWSMPQPVFEPTFIIWKPIEHGGKYYAAVHKKPETDSGKLREVYLVVSDDGLDWKKISTIRAGNWESETTIHFDQGDKLFAFLRQKYGSPESSILESIAPFVEWKAVPGPVHFSGHAMRTFEGVDYLLSRTRKGSEMGTMIYLWDEGQLTPYCELPAGGDCAYPEAVQIGDEMLVSYYSSHEGSTNIYLARVPLKKGVRW